MNRINVEIDLVCKLEGPDIEIINKELSEFPTNIGIKRVSYWSENERNNNLIKTGTKITILDNEHLEKINQQPPTTFHLITDKSMNNASYIKLKTDYFDLGIFHLQFKNKILPDQILFIQEWFIKLFYLILNRCTQRLYDENYNFLMNIIDEMNISRNYYLNQGLTLDLIEGIAHRVANPLAVILANQELVEIMVMQLINDENVNNTTMMFNKSEIDEIFSDQKKAIQRLSNFISELRNFSRGSKIVNHHSSFNFAVKKAIYFSKLQLRLPFQIELSLQSSSHMNSTLFGLSQTLFHIFKMIKDIEQSGEKYSIHISTEDKKDHKTELVIKREFTEQASDPNIEELLFIKQLMKEICYKFNVTIRKQLIIFNLIFETI